MDENTIKTKPIDFISALFDERTYNVLVKNNIKSVQDFLDLNQNTDAYISSLKGCWRKSLKIIRYVYEKLIEDYRILRPNFLEKTTDFNIEPVEYKEYDTDLNLNWIFYNWKKICWEIKRRCKRYWNWMGMH